MRYTYSTYEQVSNILVPLIAYMITLFVHISGALDYDQEIYTQGSYICRFTTNTITLIIQYETAPLQTTARWSSYVMEHAEHEFDKVTA